MPPSHAHRFRSAVALLVILAAALGGCNREDLMQRLDPASRARLEAIPEAATVLLSLTGSSPLGELPPLGPGGRLLGRSGTSVLLEVPRSVLPALAGVDDLERASIWGSGETVGKLDPALRADLLRAVDAGETGSPRSLLATMRENASDPKQVLEEAGASVRTVAGPVVTLDASAETVFRLLQLPEVRALNRPRMLRPLGTDPR